MDPLTSKEVKAYKWKQDDAKFYAIIDEKETIEIETEEVKFKCPYNKNREKKAMVFIVDDSEFGKLPYNIFEQKRRKDVAGKLQTSAGVTVNTADIDIIALAPLRSQYPLIKCPKCLKGIPKQSTFCPFCGSKLHVREKYYKRYKRGIAVLGFIGICLLIIALNSTGLFTPAFEKETKYYKKNGYIVYDNYTWQESKNIDGIFFRVTRDQLRQEANLLARRSVSIYIDKDSKIIWLSCIDLEQERGYVYLWTP